MPRQPLMREKTVRTGTKTGNQNDKPSAPAKAA
jgi:hypothetical protein